MAPRKTFHPAGQISGSFAEQPQHHRTKTSSGALGHSHGYNLNIGGAANTLLGTATLPVLYPR